MPAGFMRSRSSRVTHRTRRHHTVAIDHCSSVTVALSQRLTAHMEAQMRNGKEAAHFGVPWEKTYGYAQAVRVGNTTIALTLGSQSECLREGLGNSSQRARSPGVPRM